MAKTVIFIKIFGDFLYVASSDDVALTEVEQHSQCAPETCIITCLKSGGNSENRFF